MEVIAAFDYLDKAVDVYNANHSPVAQLADLTEWRKLSLPTCDGIVGGPPCQPFSHAGKGLGQADARDMLPTFLEIVGELRPKWFLMENVPGLLSERHSRYLFSQLGYIRTRGYDVHTGLLNAADFGVPQTRVRAFFFGVRGDISVAPAFMFPASTHSEAGEPSLFAPVLRWVSIGDVISDPPAPYLTTKQARTTVTLDRPAPTLKTDDRLMWVDTNSDDWREKVAHRVRSATILERCHLMTFPASWTGLTPLLVGNAVPPLLAWRWGRSIATCFPDSRILSLFSGAGGFDFIAYREPPGR